MNVSLTGLKPQGGTDVMGLRALHLCSGYGGFELALRHAGIPATTVCHVEREAHAAATLVARMEDKALDQAPIWDDLESFDGTAWSGRVDLLTAGFPCQPFSTAGKHQGVCDDRWLWPEIARVVREVGPSFIVLENVPGLVRHGLRLILSDLAEIGFDAEWGCLPASAVGATHHRERFWLVANTNDLKLFDTGEPGAIEAEVPRFGHDGFPPSQTDVDGWRRWVDSGLPQPVFRRGDDGPSFWMDRPFATNDRLRLAGNGLVPQCAAEAIRQLAERMVSG